MTLRDRVTLAAKTYVNLTRRDGSLVVSRLRVLDLPGLDGHLVILRFGAGDFILAGFWKLSRFLGLGHLD